MKGSGCDLLHPTRLKAVSDTNPADDIAGLGPPALPEPGPPQILTDAAGHLEVATSEFYLALQRFELWRVLAYDPVLVQRLGKGFATAGYISVRSAIFEALLLTLTRMFDPGARGRRPLSFKTICNDVCRPEVRAYVAGLRSADARGFPARLGLVTPLDDADRKIFEESAEEEACRATQRADREFNALVVNY